MRKETIEERLTSRQTDEFVMEWKIPNGATMIELSGTLVKSDLRKEDIGGYHFEVTYRKDGCLRSKDLQITWIYDFGFKEAKAPEPTATNNMPVPDNGPGFSFDGSTPQPIEIPGPVLGHDNLDNQFGEPENKLWPRETEEQFNKVYGQQN
jgi:hypothetical protein